MGYRQVLHGCEAGGQWLLQGAGYCFHQEVAWFFPEIAKFLPSSPHTTFSARGSLDIGSRPNVRWACFTDNKHILFFQWLPLWYDSNSKRGALQDCRFYAKHQGKGGSAPETSSATKSEEKRMFSQASAWVVCCRRQFLYLVIWDVSRLIPCQVTTRESKGTQSKGTSIFTSPHPPIPCHHASWKSPKISFLSISPYSQNISFSLSSLHFRPDFSLLPVGYPAPLCLSGPSLQ